MTSVHHINTKLTCPNRQMGKGKGDKQDYNKNDLLQYVKDNIRWSRLAKRALLQHSKEYMLSLANII